jgi:dethiobiotin synthetase
MTAPQHNTGSDPIPPSTVAGIGVMSVTPDDQTAIAAAMLIALLAHQGANVAAMVPVETGIDEPCEPNSRGSLLRWAAGHLDNPRLVTPFALDADRPAMHAADASGLLLHTAAFDRARDELCDGRTRLVVLDMIGPLDPISPSLTMLDLFERWGLELLAVVSATRSAVSHARILQSLLLPRENHIAGVILSPPCAGGELDDDAVGAVEDTLAASLGCPVIRLPRVLSVHDRAELLAAADACGLHRVTRHTAR